MIKVTNLYKQFENGTVITKVLKGIDLEVKEGTFMAIYGPSGSGKSTFIYQMALLDSPTEGVVEINGIKGSTLSEAQKTSFRLKNFGFVFQDYAILQELSALENVALPLLMGGMTYKQASKQAAKTLERLGLGDKLGNTPKQLSGGQQQRVSIARAVAGNPSIIFADEPTANLDSESSQSVIDALKELHQQGQTIVLVTHEKEYTEIADRIITLRDGVITKDQETHNGNGKHQGK